MRFLTLRVENVSKIYGENFRLQNLVLNVEPGEIIGLLGSKGSGKTSFLNLIIGKQKPSSGTILVSGKDVHQGRKKIKKNIGYLLPVHKNLLFLRGWHYLWVICKLYSRPFDITQIELLAQRFQIDLHQAVKSYTLEELQAFRLIFAFIEPVDLIVLDEPVLNLSLNGLDWYHRYIKIARAKGTSILFTTENISEVERVCDWVVLINNGRIISQERGVQFRARSMRKIEMRFAKPVKKDQFAELPNIQELYFEGNKMRCMLTGDPDLLIKTASKLRVTDFISTPPTLDETLAIYNTI
ncbi:MAG: hypothetical protein CL609_06875 [Anaerolineaceae bacterium]|nr:hypothetical protein [Anaerolineaceae bacterium]